MLVALAFVAEKRSCKGVEKGQFKKKLCRSVVSGGRVKGVRLTKGRAPIRAGGLKKLIERVEKQGRRGIKEGKQGGEERTVGKWGLRAKTHWGKKSASVGDRAIVTK